MENNEILDLLEQEYLQEYRKIQNRLLKKIRESSYLNVELHDIANQLYTAQLRGLQPQLFTMGMKLRVSMESCAASRSRCC